ncbi:hypothetical protein VB735_10165 [Halotia wernerae UHCC 0503]|nr:hypothetical protein [Halotia wernerae UHCC 0503]
MKKKRQYLINKSRHLKNIIHLYKISSEIGFDKIISLINLFENEYGHQKSVRLGKPVDAFLNPLPWYTYPAIEYLKQFDFSNKNIFEYGSGNSSIFWSSLAKSVTSVEIDPLWFEVISKSKPSNLNIYLKEKKSEYVFFIENGNTPYDLVVIDGSYRYECSKAATKHLSDDGLIILDNSERYPKLCSDLRSHDLIQVDFFGFGPINYYTWTTSLFFQRKCRLRPLNKLPHFGIGSLCQELDE